MLSQVYRNKGIAVQVSGELIKNKSMQVKIYHKDVKLYYSLPSLQENS